MSRAVLGIENGGFSHGVTRVFENVTFQLDDARTALVGENGAGKSTLLKCLTGELELNDGQIVKSRGLHVGYVPQDIPEGYADKSVRDVLLERLASGDGSEEWKVDVLLADVEMDEAQANGRFGALSGGWQRLMLIAAAAKLDEPNLLILDEPTNHLDLTNIALLERWIRDDWRMPMLIVSHDREFLNRMTSRTIFLRRDGAHAFRTTFSHAREELLRRDAAAAKRRALEEKEIARLEQVAARYKVWGVINDDFHRKQKATEKRIERIEADRTQVYVAKDRKLALSDAEIDAKIALRVEDFDVTTPDGRKLFRIDRFTVRRGDRIALLGENGAGKSMLLGALKRAHDAMGAHYDGGAAIRFNPSTKLSTFDQRMIDLPTNITPLQYLSDSQALNKQAARDLAGAGFAFARAQEKIGTLSYGERARLVFLKMRRLEPNLYLLDEPTNHLDIEGQEDLEQELDGDGVTCIFVSHDRYFTRTAATRFFEIRKAKLVETESADEFFARLS